MDPDFISLFLKISKSRLVESRLGLCREIRNVIINFSAEDISCFRNEVNKNELKVENYALKNGIPAKSNRQVKWKVDNKTTADMTYGYYLNSCDRLQFAVNELLSSNTSRAAHIQIDHLPGNQPCATSFNLAIRNNTLFSTVTFRSLDLIDGLKYDAILFWDNFHQEALSRLNLPNISLGEMTFFITSLHFYESDNQK